MTRRKSQKKSSLPKSKLRVASFYLVTFIAVLILFSMGELILRLCVPAPQVSLYDPYVSFSGLRPLFVLDSTGTRFETADERLAAFRRQSFGSKKGPETLRVFCLGGSTVQGRPYSVETSFTAWLALNLRAADPGREYEIINCGGISYASYRLVPIVRELFAYEPDLLIICTGHNEFIEDRTYRHIKRMPHVLVRLHWTLLKLRSYSLADRFFSRRRARRVPQTILSAEVQTKLDSEKALESYRRDEQWRQGTIEHFRHNLETMVRMSNSRGIPVILMHPVSNLKDCPPFKSESRAGLSESEKRQVADLRQRARQVGWDDVYGKIVLLEQAIAIDDQDAGLLFMLGTYYAHIGRWVEAEKWFIRAKDEDICPLRILEPMHEIIEDVAQRQKVPRVDVRALFKDQTDDGIPGHEWLLDHAHPTVTGHQLIANALFRVIEEMRLVHASEGWTEKRDKLWQQHLSSLDNAYYARGVARLRRLQQWSRGRIPRE